MLKIQKSRETRIYSCMLFLSLQASIAQMVLISDIFTEGNCKFCRVQNKNDFCKLAYKHIYIYKCVFLKHGEQFNHGRWEENSEHSKIRHYQEILREHFREL